MQDYNRNDYGRTESQYRNYQDAVPVGYQDTAGASAFINRVYGWMCGGLLLSAVLAMLVAYTPALRNVVLGNRAVYMVLIVLEIITVIALSAGSRSMSASLAKLGFLFFAALNGMTLSVIFLGFDANVIGLTFGVSAGMFGVTSLFGYVTKKDLSGIGGFCFMGLIGIIIATIVNIFLRSPGLYYAISYLGLFIFIGLTAWDTQKIKQMSMVMDTEMAASDSGQKYAIFGALELYLDFINMFLFLLRIFGGGRR